MKRSFKVMERKIENNGLISQDDKEVALGICFGSGIGILAGALLNNVMLGLSAGGVLGIIIGVVFSNIRKYKK